MRSHRALPLGVCAHGAFLGVQARAHRWCNVEQWTDLDNSVMDLIGRLDARRHTQQLLLEDFMRGFIYHRFEEKRKVIGAWEELA